MVELSFEKFMEDLAPFDPPTEDINKLLAHLHTQKLLDSNNRFEEFVAPVAEAEHRSFKPIEAICQSISAASHAFTGRGTSTTYMHLGNTQTHSRIPGSSHKVDAVFRLSPSRLADTGPKSPLSTVDVAVNLEFKCELKHEQVVDVRRHRPPQLPYYR